MRRYYISNAKVNKAAIDKAMNVGLEKVGKSAALAHARKRAERIKAQTIEDFRSKAVVQELNAGPSAANRSNTITGGYGNLWSFIGFNDAGQNPTSIIEKYLENSMQINAKNARKRIDTRRKTVLWKFKFSEPKLREIYDITPLPWEGGRSWVEGIQRGGISGIGSYMYQKEGFMKSRSRTGVQTRSGNFPRQFRKKPFMDEVLSAMQKRLRREGMV